MLFTFISEYKLLYFKFIIKGINIGPNKRPIIPPIRTDVIVEAL